MRYQFGIFLFVILISVTLLVSQNILMDDSLQTFLDKSGPYIGSQYSKDLGLDGKGIVVGVIDTGVDHLHPDLYGFGPEGKVIKGYNFVEGDKMPIDTNGHGTQVAGIIAADGALKGIAPKAKIIAYKVSEDGESVSSDLIIKAIEQAIEDEVDIINISLGVNRTNSKIDEAVSKAVENGIVVVAAAGNDGPALKTIGSPGINPNSITVGASYNNITASLVATLSVNEEPYQVIPMIGTGSLKVPIEAEIVFGQYARERDFAEGNFSGTIVLAERGSDVEGEIVYFSDKEKNAANAGAKALLVYNNEPGIFLGELIHEFTSPDYEPKIPTLSMSREDGLILKDIIQKKTVGSLHIFYNPDYVAHFSSRGPVSPFYIKPDLVAPGAFVNTTLSGGRYNFTSGTSFATPHVTGAAALLLQKNPDYKPDEIKSILLTTTDPVSDAYQQEFPSEIAGSGRLNMTTALRGDLIIIPPSVIFNLTPDKTADIETVQISKKDGELDDIKVFYDIPSDIALKHSIEGDKIFFTASYTNQVFGSIEGRIFIESNGVVYNIPILVHSTEASLDVTEENGELNFFISYPEDWTYAKISIINAASGETDSTSATPNKISKLSVYENGEYWVEAQVRVNNESFDAFEKVKVESPKEREFPAFDFIEIPQRQILIVFGIILLVSMVGFKVRPKAR